MHIPRYRHYPVWKILITVILNTRNDAYFSRDPIDSKGLGIDSLNAIIEDQERERNI